MKCRCGCLLHRIDATIVHETEDHETHRAYFAVAPTVRAKPHDVVEFLWGDTIVFAEVKRVSRWQALVVLPSGEEHVVDEYAVVCES